MRSSHLAPLAAFIAASTFALASGPSGCATSIEERDYGETSGSGGSGGASSGVGGDDGQDAGWDGTCASASDCVSLSDACSEGACINGKCGKLPINESGPCDDGKQCTQSDTCAGGVCVGGQKKFCPSSSSCFVGDCDVTTDTCVEVPGNDGAPCVDDDACTQAGTCLSGACSPGPMVDCSFLDGTCSKGYCDPLVGCKTTPLNDGTPCDDQFYCTVSDTCNAGVCAGVPNTCAAPGDVCMIGSCNEAMKTCVAVPGNNGGACDDGNDCTAGETCSNGSCLGGMPANEGVMCDDKDGCTGGTTCAGGACGNPTSAIVACIDSDMCCPAGCANDNDCLYWASGVQQNVPAGALTGWSPCYSDLYDNFSTPMSQIVNQCDKAKLLLACRPVGAGSFSTLAMAPRADVLFDCGQQFDCTHQANGVGWYYSDNYSWGYAPAGETVSRSSCDTMSQQNPDRLCWHSNGGLINGGWRCGSATGLNGDPGWERVVFEAD